MASSLAATTASSVGEESRPRETVFVMDAVTKRWRDDLPPILDAVSMSVSRGELVAVTGRNGAGKTTLLRIAAGLLNPDRGVVRLLGIDPERDRTGYNRRLGFLAAGNTSLYARLNVEHHLELWARLALLGRTTRNAAIDEVTDLFELESLRGLRVDRLSMGQRQRLRLALAFLHRPELVLLDEPQTSLDAEGVSLIGKALEQLRARGGAAVICAPEIDRAQLPVRRHYLVGEGRLAEV